ncbi:MAG: Uma2 family endonuclease [Candidatus Binatia bacterium]|nr:Uma2 family endonuclease [Candidatus Binatia bacterium]
MPKDGRWYELIKGELIKMTPPGGLHDEIPLRQGRYLQTHVEIDELGKVMVDSGFLLAFQPDIVRGLDISFVATNRFPPDGLPERFFSATPDLAMEIVSPEDTDIEVQDKVMDYLTHGTRQVWVVRPRQGTVPVYRPDGGLPMCCGRQMFWTERMYCPASPCRFGSCSDSFIIDDVFFITAS